MNLDDDHDHPTESTSESAPEFDRPPHLNRDQTPDDLLTQHPILWRYHRDHLISKVDDWENARLPQAYQDAKAALARCERTDECKDWADKAAALASYAKQTHDESLFLFAKRIQLRAYRRCSLLLNAIPRAHGANQNITDGGVRKVTRTRTDAAREVGFSERLRRTILRLASIPEDEFNEIVESEAVPTVTQLAASHPSLFYSARRKPKPPQPPLFAVDRIARTVERFARFCTWYDATYWAGCCNPDSVRHDIQTIRAWLDRYEANLLPAKEIPGTGKWYRAPSE